LRGTFARAYELLANLVSQIGWDELLKTRSAVFVMEEEYRMQKLQAEARSAPPDVESHPNGVIHEDGTVEYEPANAPTTNGHGASAPIPSAGADDNASTRALVGETIGSAATPANEKPVIDDELNDASNNGDVKDLESEGTGLVLDDEATLRSTTEAAGDDVERPSLAAMKEEEDENEKKTPVPPQDYSFSNKRLCERWLDNLFMVLYEVATRVRLSYMVIS
jgi:hypothetical protein